METDVEQFEAIVHIFCLCLSNIYHFKTTNILVTVCVYFISLFLPDAKYGVHRAATMTVPMIISASPSRSVMLPI